MEDLSLTIEGVSVIVTLVATIASLIGGTYVGSRSAAIGRMRLEDRRALRDQHLESLFELERSVRIDLSPDSLDQLVVAVREADVRIGLLPWLDRMTFGPVNESIEELWTRTFGQVRGRPFAEALDGLLSTESYPLPPDDDRTIHRSLKRYESYLLWQLRPSWLFRWRLHRHRLWIFRQIVSGKIRAFGIPDRIIPDLAQARLNARHPPSG